jgi:two-component system, NtrC family, response regulator PilR
MAFPTALLVTRNRGIVEAAQGVFDTIDHLRLEVCPGGEQARREATREDVVLVLAHLEAVGGDAGITQLLWAIAATRRPCPTLVLSDRYVEHQAATLLRAGAADYLELPADRSKLAQLVDAHTLRARFPARGGVLRRADASRLLDAGVAPELVTVGMEYMMGQIQRVAAQDTTMLLVGETGTGKTGLARLIHEVSPRRAEPFLVVDCAALSGGVIESELFGHVKGAFTGADRERPGKLAAAGTGTVLLDEVNALPMHLQSKLLRAVGERRFEPVGAVHPLPMRARLIAASNVPLEQEVAANRFRSDLYFRLNVLGFCLPPLRDRREAIAPMAVRFLEEFAGRNGMKLTRFRPEVLEALECYDWPGNVRELRNVIERMVALSEGTEIDAKDLPPAILESTRAPRVVPADRSALTLNQSREEAEVERINEALRKHRNNRQRAAAELGISRMGLYKKLHKYGLIQPTENGTVWEEPEEARAALS